MQPHPLDVVQDPELEKTQIDEIAELTVELLKKRYPDGPSFRGVHPKSHGCVRATFEVLDSIDSGLQIGVFAKPGKKYESLVRFSNADTLIRHDLRNGENGSRGMAIKIQDVEGELLYQDDESSQDFLMINTEQFAFANIPDYLKLQKILLQFNDDPSAFFAPLQAPPPTEDPAALAEFMRVKRTFDVVSKIKSLPVANPLEVAYFGAAPFAFGERHVMRVAVVPEGDLKDQVVPEDATESYLREALVETMKASEDVVFNFQIQVREADGTELHLEDATQFWTAEEASPITVAKLTIPAPQDELVNCEREFFNPWHALKEHQPIGGINRLRRAAYLASATHRRTAANS